MRILITGKGKSGSWKIRGEELGGLVGRVLPNATYADCIESEVIVVIKKFGQFGEFCNHIDRPIIWDLIDFYPQPECGAWSREFAIDWVRSQIQKFKPAGVIYATQRMMSDVDLPGVWIPHHARPDTVINPIREKVEVVGYEGDERYLGKWRPLLEAECRRRGWRFVCNDRPVGMMDIVVAFRDAQFNGYVQRHWKSNVKLANAHAAGTPFIGPPESGYLETAAGGEQWVEDPAELSAAFDSLEPYEVRREIAMAFRRNTITAQACANTLRDYAQELLHY